MAFDPLASVSDLPSAWSGNPKAEKALNVASSAIRNAAGSIISRGSGTVVVDGTAARILRLPGPIVAVASVEVDGRSVSDWIVNSNGLLRRCGWGDAYTSIRVSYTYGLLDVPDDIVDLCAQLAVSWLQHDESGGGSTAGLVSVRVDDASETYTQEAAAAVSPVHIPEKTERWLAARFGGGSTAVIEATL